ncbi:SDR family NAD(P)-dependent oxidoreductase [Terriglobus aquaticus]|uniref:SDR family NAD(P)-dependent oxidoreductase n=1 Tax=Terriglobus aquaticus TaxID=940139 RepID=A0ABW9KFK7_9BACT|nr:glucose 1-dehydrogenase [Terriglobus aquaticus]
MGKLNGKIAIVTGASKGIGASIAEELGREGASVVVNYASSKDGADKVVKRITDAGGKAVAVGANVSKPEEIAKLVEGTKAAFGGRVDVLVNNAGVYQFAPLEQTTPELFHRIFDTNVLGLLLTTQAVVPLFPETGGSIINIGSLVGRNASANAAVYSATKGAVDSITVALSKELGPKKIRVNSLNPGPVVTEGAAGFTEFFETLTPQTPLGRVGQPSDIGRAATFFASDDSAWITGEVVVAAGGLR